MSSRNETLHRIFEGTGVAERLSGEQRRELLAHLDDAVEAKVKAGVAELEAVGLAFEEIGNLKKLRFPTSSARAWSGATAELGYLLLLGFSGLQLCVMPSVLEVFRQVQVSLPGLTAFFGTLGEGMSFYWPLTVALLAALAVLLVRVPRDGRWRPAFDGAMAIGGAGLFGGSLAAMILPFIALFSGLSSR